MQGRSNRIDHTGYSSNQFSGYRLNGRVFDLSDLSDRRRCYVKTARMICSDIVFLSSCPFPHIFLKSFLFCVLEWVISHLADYHGEKLIFKIHLEQKQHYVLSLKKQYFSQKILVCYKKNLCALTVQYTVLGTVLQIINTHQ